MCESHAYMVRNGQEEKLLEDVTFIQPGDGEVIIRSLFGEELTVKGRISEIRLMDHKILLEELP